VQELVEKGNLSESLIIYNRTTSKAEALSKKIGNSTVSYSVADAVSKSDIIFTCLGDEPVWVMMLPSRATSRKP
jgi:3-hydroxyisobutyrate dehydrogenase-like beta-hydroxyacid dehydrogenase